MSGLSLVSLVHGMQQVRSLCACFGYRWDAYERWPVFGYSCDSYELEALDYCG
jgi:hypothetical protein